MLLAPKYTSINVVFSFYHLEVRKIKIIYIKGRGNLKKRMLLITAFFLCVLLFCIKIQLTGYAKDERIVKILPGEFEKQQAIWVMWPSEIYNLNHSPVNPVMTEIVKSLAPYIKVNVAVSSDDEEARIKAFLLKYGCSGSNICYYTVRHYSIWARDVGPIFVRDNHNQLCVVNFQFNNYGRYGDYHYINTEGRVDIKIAQLLNVPVIHSRLVSEGGSVESNGKGTIILTESVALKHNTGLSKRQIEDEYKRVLGVKKIIWLKKGLAEDQVTDGHVDEFTRFADANTILLAQVLPGDKDSSSLSRKSYLNLEENYKMLMKETDQDGKAFHIIRVPMPPTLYQETFKDGEMPVRSYLNYVVSNGVVLLQTYWEPGRPYILKITEERLVYTFKSVFPGREIICIHAENINTWGGGTHCVTQHMPTGDLAQVGK